MIFAICTRDHKNTTPAVLGWRMLLVELFHLALKLSKKQHIVIPKGQNRLIANDSKNDIIVCRESCFQIYSLDASIYWANVSLTVYAAKRKSSRLLWWGQAAKTICSVFTCFTISLFMLKLKCYKSGSALVVHVFILKVTVVEAMNMTGNPIAEERIQLQTLTILALRGVLKSSALTGWHTAT